jgi:hypothetical protein
VSQDIGMTGPTRLADVGGASVITPVVIKGLGPDVVARRCGLCQGWSNRMVPP